MGIPAGRHRDVGVSRTTTIESCFEELRGLISHRDIVRPDVCENADEVLWKKTRIVAGHGKRLQKWKQPLHFFWWRRGGRPDSGQVRSTVSCSRRGTREVRLPIRRPRNAGRRMIHPLRVRGDGRHQKNTTTRRKSIWPDGVTAVTEGLTNLQTASDRYSPG